MKTITQEQRLEIKEKIKGNGTILKLIFIITIFILIINLARNLIYNNGNNLTFTKLLESMYNLGQDIWQLPTLENLTIVNNWGILEFVKDFINLFINLFNAGIYFANSMITLISFLIRAISILIIGV